MMTTWHGSGFAGSVKWRVDSDGVALEPGIYPRTDGPPATVTRIWSRWSSEIQHCAYIYSVPVELLMATIATESRADLDPKQDRKEPGYQSDEATPNRVSVGICHPLISTARAVTGFAVSRAWLTLPSNNIRVAAMVLRNDAPRTGFDPPLSFACYNSGGLSESNKNPFKLRSTGEHISRAVSFTNDAVVFLRERGGAKRDIQWLLSAYAAGVLV